jgi:hypothetical protein
MRGGRKHWIACARQVASRTNGREHLAPGSRQPAPPRDPKRSQQLLENPKLETKPERKTNGQTTPKHLHRSKKNSSSLHTPPRPRDEAAADRLPRPSARDVLARRLPKSC